jgi:hypothetical protein
MLGGSGTTVVAWRIEMVAAAPMDPLCAGSCVKVKFKVDPKGPPLKPPNVPGVQFPNTLMFRKPGTFSTTVIAVLANVPNTLLPKIRLVGLVRLNENEGKNCVGMPVKTPVCELVDTKVPMEKVVAVLRLPVGEPLAVGEPMSTKAWAPIVVACTPLARARQIAIVDSPKRITGRIATSF